jgi:hypothetical protein
MMTAAPRPGRMKVVCVYVREKQNEGEKEVYDHRR